MCVTLIWQYNIKKSGAVTVEKHKDSVRLDVPLSLNATVGVDGKSAKILGLSKKDITAKLMMTADFKIQMQKNWCPKLISDMNYQWLETPKLSIAGDLKLHLQKTVDKALGKNLVKIEQDLIDVVDCRKFRERLKQQWKVHQFTVMLPDGSPAYISITPVSAHIGNSHALENKLNISIGLITTTEVTDTSAAPEPLVLPDLSPSSTGAGVTELSALLKLPYKTLNNLISDRLDLQEPATDKFTVKSVKGYPSGENLIFAVQIDRIEKSRFTSTAGELFLSGKPVVNPVNNSLRFENIAFTRILDNKLFDIISAALHRRILGGIREEAVFDLNHQIEKLENSIIRALSDPAKTGGLLIHAKDPKITLVAINPENGALAVIIHLSTELSGTIPIDTLIR